MIELADFRILVKNAPYNRGLPYETHMANLAARREEVIAFVKAQAEAYKVASEGQRGLGRDGGDAHLQVAADGENVLSIRAGSTSAFKEFLQKKTHELIEAIEAPCGTQFMVFAGFVPVPHQTNMQQWGGGSTLHAAAFNTISHGVSPGRALTDGERQARIAMNDAVFEKLSAGLKRMKQTHPSYVIEVQEKQLGAFFVRVTPEDNREYGVSSYNVSSAISAVIGDRENVAAVVAGPALYPTDVARLRAPKETAPSSPPPRKPKSLEL